MASHTPDSHPSQVWEAWEGCIGSKGRRLHGALLLPVGVAAGVAVVALPHKVVRVGAHRAARGACRLLLLLQVLSSAAGAAAAQDWQGDSAVDVAAAAAAGRLLALLRVLAVRWALRQHVAAVGAAAAAHGEARVQGITTLVSNHSLWLLIAAGAGDVQALRHVLQQVH